MVVRRVIAVAGVVQGVGFRPFVHRLASANSLCGYVRNNAEGVLIDVEGDGAGVAEFCRALTLDAPMLATIARVHVRPAEPQDYADFRIARTDPASSARGIAPTPPDAATCDDCLSELFDPENRRVGHPFISCTACGPRFTIVHGTPYDRERTSMAGFPMCRRCEQEYNQPSDRRFHAETICCPDCGPTLAAYVATGGGALGVGKYALDAAVAALLGGAIVAIRALGGFHLACDATSARAVARLRERKLRPGKPFAVMVADEGAAHVLCELSIAERDTLTSTARPIVLLRLRTEANVAARVAPLGGTLGVMLPSTPLHHLLLAAVNRPLVMTSGNRCGEPVATDDATAIAELGAITDMFLTHDREISARCDDSVVRVVAGVVRPVRRARGHVPRAIPLPFDVAAPVIGVGGHLKNTVCLLHRTRAHLSAHVGDLASASARQASRLAIEKAISDAGGRPAAIAHDLHPEYASSHIAIELAAAHGIDRRVAVQHHHAHVAACLAEHDLMEPVIGVAFDGAGLGTDGAIWGGEFTVVDGAHFRRSGHLAYVPLPGGDAAARRPWRSAAAHLVTLGSASQRLPAFRPDVIPDDEWSLVLQLLARPGLTPRTSSIGRLFDAVASLLGLCHVASFEGEAAMALEALAGKVTHGYPIALDGAECWSADPARIIDGVVSDLARGRDRADIAAAFHGSVRDLVVLGCERVRDETGLGRVVLTGGVFANALLTESAQEALVARGFHVHLPRLAPCNDGGLSLGQAYVAACALEEEACA